MLGETFLKSHTSQRSDWSTTEPAVYQQQQHTLDAPNTSHVPANKVWPIDVNPSSSKNQKEKTWNFQCKAQRWWSRFAPFGRGLLLGVLTSGLVLTVVLSLWITSSTTTTTTISAVTQTTTTATSSTTASTTSATTTTTTTTTTTSITTTTSTTTTTTTLNPCGLNSFRWNTTGITIMNSSQLSYVSGLFFDSNDTLYIVDETPNSVVWKLPKNATSAILIAGQLGTLGGNATQLNYPQGVYFDANRNLYVTDYYNYRVQKYRNGSMIGVTIAGISGSNAMALNQFGGLRYLCFDPTETYMYVTDCDNNRIMSYLTNSTTGSNGTVVAGGNGSGNATSQLTYPWGIDYLPLVSSYLYITNAYGHSVTQWIPGTSSGVFIAGTPGVSGNSATLLNTPMGIKIDAYLNFYVVDNGNHRVQMFCHNSQHGITIAGNGTAGSSATQLNGPRGIAFDSSMNMYITDQSNRRIQQFLKL